MDFSHIWGACIQNMFVHFLTWIWFSLHQTGINRCTKKKLELSNWQCLDPLTFDYSSCTQYLTPASCLFFHGNLNCCRSFWKWAPNMWLLYIIHFSILQIHSNFQTQRMVYSLYGSVLKFHSTYSDITTKFLLLPTTSISNIWPLPSLQRMLFPTLLFLMSFLQNLYVTFSSGVQWYLILVLPQTQQ